MKKKLTAALLVTVGILLIIYPFISNYIKDISQNKVIVNYQNEAEVLTTEQKEEKIKKAEKYNDELEKNIHVDVSLENEEENNISSYLNVLDIGEAMGYINIPKIDINLPIYHGASKDVLKNGVGHLESSSLPVGGIGTHAVLAGHTGLASGKIFDNIDKLEIGDIFFINILNKTLQYKVIKINIVEPNDTESIKVDPEKDYVTLVTCTPKFINSHRLLVTGQRFENVGQGEKQEKEKEEQEQEEQEQEQEEQEGLQKNSKEERKYEKFIKENRKEIIILGIILALIGILIWSHKYII